LFSKFNRFCYLADNKISINELRHRVWKTIAE
jgi:hypothetical protein